MTKLVLRHGLSEANNIKNYGTPAFGNPEAPLMPEGIEQSAHAGEVLRAEYGLDVTSEPVAVSFMRRSQQTAIAGGFRWFHLYSELNEEKGGASDSEIKVIILKRRPPQATRDAAQYLISNPPTERVWVTHALLIATLCQELGVYQDMRFTPKFCEIRELPL